MDAHPVSRCEVCKKIATHFMDISLLAHPCSTADNQYTRVMHFAVVCENTVCRKQVEMQNHMANLNVASSYKHMSPGTFNYQLESKCVPVCEI